jgi:hypothetical protein
MNRRTTPDQPAPPIGPLAVAHPTHDLLLVAAWASDDLDGAARAAATELVDGCSACAALASDLRALAIATRSLPPARRPRDFGLSPADAERLRPHGLRRFLAALAAPRSFSRPLAASLTTLGVAGLLLASLPGVLPFGVAGAPGAARGNDNEQVAPLDGDVGAPAPSGAPGLSFGDDRDTAGGDADPAQGGDDGHGAPAIDAAVGDSGPSVLVVLSGPLLIVGLGLFALRWTGRRLGSG